MTLKTGFKQCKTDPCLLYRLNELRTLIVIVYLDGMLEIIDNPSFMNPFESIKKEYATLSMGELEYFVGCMIKHDLTKMTLNISQPDIINKMIQLFNEYFKSLMAFNTPATPHKGGCK